MNREERIRRANILNAILITTVIASVLIFSTPEQKREVIHYGKETVRIAVIVVTSAIPYSSKIFGIPDSPQFTYAKKEYMKIKPFPEVVSKEAVRTDKKGFSRDNSDGHAGFREIIYTQKSFSEVLQYYTRELRREGWECVDNRGEYEGGAIGYTFKRKGDDFYIWTIGVDKEDVNKNKYEGEKETINFSIGIHYR